MVNSSTHRTVSRNFFRLPNELFLRKNSHKKDTIFFDITSSVVKKLTFLTDATFLIE